MNEERDDEGDIILNPCGDCGGAAVRDYDFSKPGAYTTEIHCDGRCHKHLRRAGHSSDDSLATEWNRRNPK